MKRDTPTYMSRAMKDRLASPEYSLAIYRDPETGIKEEVLEDFLDFVGEFLDDIEEEDERKKLSLMAQIQNLINIHLGYDIKKVEQAEQTLLQNWINSVKGE